MSMANQDAAMDCRDLARGLLKEEQFEKAVRLFEKATRMFADLPGIGEELAGARRAAKQAQCHPNPRQQTLTNLDYDALYGQ